MTPAEARVLLVARAESELAVERAAPPAWSPFTALHPAREVRAAFAAARSRVEHALRLAEAPDAVLAGLLASGWRPFSPGLDARADNCDYDISAGQGGCPSVSDRLPLDGTR